MISSWALGDDLPESFFSLPEKVYGDKSHYIGESRVSINKLFGASNKYFEKGEVALYSDENIRLVAFYEGLEVEGKKVAFFGYWETIDDIDINQKAFSELELWAKNKGAEKLYGPINFNTYQKNRLRVSDFDEACFPSEPYNPEYYTGIMEGLGYQVEKGFFSTIQDLEVMLSNFEPFDIPKQIQELESSGFRFCKLTKDYWMDNIKSFYSYIDVIFMDNFAYTPISEEQFCSDYGEGFASKFCPNSSYYALDDKSNLVGFFVTVPDYGPLLNNASSLDDTEKSELNYETGFPLLKDAIALGKTVGVHPKYRNSGFFLILSYLITKASLESGYKYGACSLIREDNITAKAAHLICNGSEMKQRKYALYAKEL